MEPTWRMITPTLFRAEQYAQNNSFTKIRGTDFKNILDREKKYFLQMLDELKGTETEVYNYNTVYINMHTYLLLQTDDIEEDQLRKYEENIKNVLQRNPENLISIQLLVEIYCCCEDDEQDDLISKLKDLKASEKYKTLHAIAMAEVAIFISLLDSNLLYCAKNLFDYHLPLFINNIADRDTIFWHYQYAVLGVKLLNSEILNSNCRKSPLCVFEEVRDSFEKVMQSDEKKFVSRSFIDLADSLKKLKSLINSNEYSCIQAGQNTSDLYEQSVYFLQKHKFDDAHVYERYGRYQRHLGVDWKRPVFQRRLDLDKAIKYLEKAIRLCPKRHVALHQLGLTYLAKWNIENPKPKPKHRPRERSNLSLRDKLKKEWPPSSCEEGEPNNQLRYSLQYVKKASEIVFGKSSAYLIDLGKIYALLGMNSEAEQCFKSACKLDFRKRTSPNEESKKYEHYGLFILRQALLVIDDDTFEKQVKKAKKYLKMSVEKAIFARTKPKQACEKLVMILEDEISKNAPNDKLLIELSSVYQQMNQLEIAASTLQRITDCNSNSDLLLTMRISIAIQQGLFEEAYKDLYFGLSNSLLPLNEENLSKFLCTCYKVTVERGTYDVYDFLFLLLYQWKTNDTSATPSGRSQNKYDVMILAYDSDKDFVRHVIDSFTKTSLTFYVASEDGDNNIPFGARKLDCVESALKSCRVVLYCDQGDLNSPTWISNIMDGLQIPQSMPIAIIQGLENAVPLKWRHLPKLSISLTDSFHKLLYNIFSAIFELRSLAESL